MALSTSSSSSCEPSCLATIPSRKTETIIISAVLAAVTYFFIGIRLLSRCIFAGQLWWDDYIIIISAIFIGANAATPIIMTHYGFGLHIYDVPPENFEILGQFFYVSEIIYVIVQNLPRFSLLVLYLRVFRTAKTRYFLLTIKLCLAWTICHTLAFLLAVIFQCRPVARGWDFTKPGSCINRQVLLDAGAAFSFLEDIVIMGLPYFEVELLQTSRKKKIQLMIMFVIGSFACVTAIVRLHYTSQYGKSIDFTWEDVDVVIWSQIESTRLSSAPV